jgi:hypothetical protein
MSMSLKTNGQVRKSLAEQIDRLDGVIDALSVGLKEAVASAVQEAVAEAVRLALTEALNCPSLAQALAARAAGPQPAAEPATPARPGRLSRAWSWLRAALAAAAGAVGAGLATAWSASAGWLSVVGSRLASAGSWLAVRLGWLACPLGPVARAVASGARAAWSGRRHAPAALAVGLLAGLGGWLGGPTVAAAGLGLVAAAATLAGLALRPLWGLLGGAGDAG